MVYLVNPHTNATRMGWHVWKIDLRVAHGLPPGWCTGVEWEPAAASKAGGAFRSCKIIGLRSQREERLKPAIPSVHMWPISIGPVGRKLLMTYGGRTDGEGRPTIVRGCRIPVLPLSISARLNHTGNSEILAW